jgi:uncharacterized YigZ family protein
MVDVNHVILEQGDWMRYLKHMESHELVVNKSRFIALLYPLEHIEDRDRCLKDAKKRHPKANHYVTASIWGESGEHVTADDDGEPARTAGYPVLDVLRHHDVTHVLCVVVRYFGGIKLGAGGLVRAYTKACAEVMKQASFYIKKTVAVVRITFDYTLIDKLHHLLEKKATIINSAYAAMVTFEIVFDQSGPDILDDVRHLLHAYETLAPHQLLIEA